MIATELSNYPYTLQFTSRKDFQFSSIMSNLWIELHNGKKICKISNSFPVNVLAVKILPKSTLLIALTFAPNVKWDLSFAIKNGYATIATLI